MKKIQSLFQRNYEGDRLVRDEVVPGSEWVIRGEGIATRKYDGTCAMIKDGKLFRRYELKKGKAAPLGFVPAQEPDPITGDCPGWFQCEPTNPSDKWFMEAFKGDEVNGTYELCGPKIQGNPEKYSTHVLVSHALAEELDAPRTYQEIKDWLSDKDIEGIVWHHPDGRMVKIKKKDFGFKR